MSGNNYEISVRHTEWDDDNTIKRCGIEGVIQWMVHREMIDLFGCGSDGAFLIDGERTPAQRAFLKDARTILQVEPNAARMEVWKAYHKSNKATKAQLGLAYEKHLDPRAWIDQVVEWCEANQHQEYDLCGNESLVGTITRF